MRFALLTGWLVYNKNQKAGNIQVHNVLYKKGIQASQPQGYHSSHHPPNQSRSQRRCQFRQPGILHNLNCRQTRKSPPIKQL